MELRRATVDDVPALVRVHARAIAETCARDYTPEQIESWLDIPHADRLMEGVTRGQAYFVCVDDDGEILGFARRNGPCITALYVSPDHERRGVGRMLLARLEADARDAGLPELTAHSTVTAVGFYERLGYENLGEVTCVLSRAIPLDAFEIRKAL